MAQPSMVLARAGAYEDTGGGLPGHSGGVETAAGLGGIVDAAERVEEALHHGTEPLAVPGVESRAVSFGSLTHTEKPSRLSLQQARGFLIPL